MKKILFSLSILFMTVVFSCAQQPSEKKDKRAPQISFKVLEHDYGTIEQGANGTYEFEFKNTGKEPLVINHVGTSCGCTVPDWPKNPIPKGKSGKITVKYDTNRIGAFTKTISVNSNATNSTVTLTIKGTVNSK